MALRLQIVIYFLRYRLTPLVGGFLTGNLYRDMAEPAIPFGPMPVLHSGRDRNDHTGDQAYRLLAFLLIPSAACRADQQLSSASFGVMNVPVIAASGFKGDICQEYRTLAGFRQRIQIGIPDKILGEARIRLSLAKYICLPT